MPIADFKVAQLQKSVNAIQKDIGMRKKVLFLLHVLVLAPILIVCTKAKENADDLIAKKAEIDKEIAALRIKEGEAELALKSEATKIGNIVHPSVPISLTEVIKEAILFLCQLSFIDINIFPGR